MVHSAETRCFDKAQCAPDLGLALRCIVVFGILESHVYVTSRALYVAHLVKPIGQEMFRGGFPCSLADVENGRFHFQLESAAFLPVLYVEIAEHRI